MVYIIHHTYGGLLE